MFYILQSFDIDNLNMGEKTKLETSRTFSSDLNEYYIEVKEEFERHIRRELSKEQKQRLGKVDILLKEDGLMVVVDEQEYGTIRLLKQ